VHPHDAKSIDETTYDSLRNLAERDKVVAYGEIGLDFFRNRSPGDIQIKRFGEQLELAGELGLPVIIHDREAPQGNRRDAEGMEGQLGGCDPLLLRGL